MSDYSTGISGLSAAQKALEVIGNNVANAATEGYHRQRIELSPAYSVYEEGILVGGGVEINGVTRLMEGLLEQEILRQKSLLEHVGCEVDTLRTVESRLGEFSGEEGGLNAAIAKFFDSVQSLSLHPDDIVWQNHAVNSAAEMASRFRTLAESLAALEAQIRMECHGIVESINALAARAAELNGTIKRLEITGATANNLRDQRDQLISDLSELVPVQLQNREYGVVDVVAAGIPVVTGTSCTSLEVGLGDDGDLGVSVLGEGFYTTSLEGGRVGGLMSLKNDLLAGVERDLDLLALAIIREINHHHVQGVSSEGSFTDLSGWALVSENLADFDPPVTDGTAYFRVTDTVTGQVTRHAIDIDASTDSLNDIAADITAISGLTASVSSSRLRIQADATHKFDFLPSVLPEPTASSLTGASPPGISVSGIYTGGENQTLTFTALGTGSVGNGVLQLAVTDGAGAAVATLNVGSGYAAGDALELGNGIRISLGMGDVVAGDTFEVEAFFETDTSGFLAAAGINTFFSGRGASDIAVCSDISAEPERLATAIGADFSDNTNIVRMAALREQAISSLGGQSCGGFYRGMVADIGLQVSLKQIHLDNVEVILQNLTARQSEISGVDINEEAAQLMVFEQMFEAMAKYISTVQSSINSLMEIV